MLDRACRQAGFGLVSWIERAEAVTAARYSAKCAGYASKSAGEQGLCYAEWIELNGGKKPWHWTRGYTGGVPMRAWLQRVLPSSDAGPWVPTSAPDRHRL